MAMRKRRREDLWCGGLGQLTSSLATLPVLLWWRLWECFLHIEACGCHVGVFAGDRCWQAAFCYRSVKRSLCNT